MTVGYNYRRNPYPFGRVHAFDGFEPLCRTSALSYPRATRVDFNARPCSYCLKALAGKVRA